MTRKAVWHCLPSLSFALLALAATSAQAEASAAPPSAGGLLQGMVALIVVLGLMVAAAWFMRRMGLIKNPRVSNVKVIGGVNVGNRERVLVVEVADQWIVVGVAPGRVNALTTMPKQDVPVEISSHGAAADAGPQNFAAWLKQTIEKRNGR